MERGIAVRQGLRFLRAELPRILATPPDVLSPRMIHVIEGLAEDWRRLDERINHARAYFERTPTAAPVYSWFTEDFDTLDLKEAKALLGELAS